MKKQLSVLPTKKESALGILYLMLSYLVLSWLFPVFNTLLPRPLSVSGVNIVFFCVNFLAMAGIFHRLLRKELGRFLPNAGRIFGCFFAGLLLYWLGTFAVSSLILFVDPEFTNINDSNVSQMMEADTGLLSFCTVFLVPVAEELMFRGALFAGLYRRWRIAPWVASTALFALIHVQGYIGLYPPQMLLLCFTQYIPAGLSLAWAYRRSDSILTPILMHIAINAVGILAMR